ncbi:MAG TPA: hypothetical protein VKE98_05605 [Gemmataceae bacterium]|nr:hypothetical protein [Gemmataceae bacterium]
MPVGITANQAGRKLTLGRHVVHNQYRGHVTLHASMRKAIG